MSPAILLLFALTGAEPTSSSVAQECENGRLVVCIASKCEYDDGQPADVEGPSGLAALAHKYGFPVTYYMKPFTVEACRTLLKSWHDQYGDEVGWLSDGTPFDKAEAELARMRRLAERQSITTAGNLRYGLDWSNFYLRQGIQSVWGRCYEQRYLFDTDKCIPKADVRTSKNGGHLQVAVKVALESLPDYMGDRLPYGVMPWGDYSAWKVPADSPAGTKILDSHGLFVPMLLKPGVNTLELTLPEKSKKPTVFELNVERFRHDQLVAAAAVQGLANRDAPQVFLQTVDADWMITFKHNGIVHSPEVLKKYRSVDDAWKDYYSTKRGLHFETLPTLDALATKAGSAVHGVVLYDPRNPGEVPVAITLAGLRDAVPVTEAVRKECPALAALPVLEDIRGRFADRIAAQRWAIGELLPQCSQDGAFSYTGGIDAMSLDIAVARKMFVYQLAHLSPDVVPNAEERAQFEKREGGLNPPDGPLIQKILAHLKPISPIWGWGGSSEATYLFSVSKGGALVMCAQVPNISLHARIKPAKMPLRQRHLKAEDVRVEPKHYVAFMVNEGDTMKCAGTMMLCGGWLEPERGRLPINWGVSPYLCEQFPGMMEFYYSTQTENDYFFDGPGGYGYMAPKFLPRDVLMPFAERTRQGNLAADTRISDLWYFYPLQPGDLRNRWLAAMGLSGLTQWRGPQRATYPEGCPPIIDSQHYYDKATPEELATQLIREAEKAPRPWFTVVYAGDPHRFWEISKHLPPERFKIVRLDELFVAATKSRQIVEGQVVQPADAAR